MSAIGGGFNRSTQHSISFFLLGFESQGLCTLPAIPKVPVFSAAVEPRKYPRRIVAHSIFPIQDRECCVDRLNRQSLADILRCASHVRFTPNSGHLRRTSPCPLCVKSENVPTTRSPRRRVQAMSAVQSGPMPLRSLD